MLQRLPAEIFDVVARHCDMNSLKRLATTSHDMNIALIRYIQHHLHRTYKEAAVVRAVQYLSFDHNRQFLLEESNPRFLSLAFLQAAAKADPATLNFMLDNACIDLSTVVDDAFWIDLENYAENLYVEFASFIHEPLPTYTVILLAMALAMLTENYDTALLLARRGFGFDIRGLPLCNFPYSLPYHPSLDELLKPLGTERHMVMDKLEHVFKSNNSSLRLYTVLLSDLYLAKYEIPGSLRVSGTHYWPGHREYDQDQMSSKEVKGVHKGQH